MKNYNCQNLYYMIVCALIGLAHARPLSYDNSVENLRPTATKTTVEPDTLDTKLPEVQQQSIEPALEAPAPFELNERGRRALSEAQLNEPVDVDFDMELAEVNLFRPLFRYRAEVARNVGRARRVG
ncbi:PREDICTED: uncharacterized protein LOC108973850 [Bactrocera latifrons]|uniref:uncharacterized protein LOC108973850 n=1 Tax=Bactrocera latifrons TaxID=174628 RepID=UPI0008DE4B2E|nr:PREDICTED: uncharacterized protein LOC108973850 [Bactrocera latifrons]